MSEIQILWVFFTFELQVSSFKVTVLNFQLFQQGNTALHLAVMGNFHDLTQALVDAKAEIDLPNLVT
jgi:hypothetical protein